jgi:hypothetical protein
MRSLLIKNHQVVDTKFELGDLVIAKNGLLTDFVILITSVSNENRNFAGVVILKGSSITAIGVYEKAYKCQDFELFHGEIKLTQ